MSRLHIRTSTLAEKQIENIYYFSCGKWGKLKAQEYLASLKQRFILLATNPKLAIKHDQHIYRFPCESHVIYFQLSSNCIEFVAVLHKNEVPLRSSEAEH